jgi:hypothetical protein
MVKSKSVKKSVSKTRKRNSLMKGGSGNNNNSNNEIINLVEESKKKMEKEKMEKEKMEKDSKNLNTERVPPRPLKPQQRTQINIGPRGPTGHNSSKKNNYPISKELLRQPEPPLPPPRRLTGPFGPSGQPQASRRQTGPSSFTINKKNKTNEPLYEIPVPVESVESVEPLYEIPVPVPVAINNRQKRPKMPLPRIKKNNRK